MSQLTCIAKPFGKTGQLPLVSDVRLILPQSSILTMLDFILAERLNSFIDLTLPTNSDLGTFCGARPKTQVLDITYTLQSSIEKAIDTQSQGAIGQCDILQFFDNLPMLTLMAWLLRKQAPPALVFGVLRHQLCTKVTVRLPQCSKGVVVRNRVYGGLTGSRLAVALARIPVESMLATLGPSWKNLGFAQAVSVGTWVDNCYAISYSASGVVRILNQAEEYLQQDWGLEIKPSSREVMPVIGHDEDLDDDKWPIVKSMKCLGHLLEANGSVEQCFQFCVILDSSHHHERHQHISPLSSGCRPLSALPCPCL